jgi:hypothetical protein
VQPNGSAACSADCGPQCACDVFVASYETGAAPSTLCDATEVAAFEIDGTGNCLDCLLNLAPCIDDASTSGLDCDDPFTGAGAGESTQQCIDVLACELGVTPAAIPAPVTVSGTPLSAYCGSTQVAPCESGSSPPTGACVAQITAGYPAGFQPMQIGTAIAGGPYAGSRAGHIVTCAINNCPMCVMGSAN